MASTVLTFAILVACSRSQREDVPPTDAQAAEASARPATPLEPKPSTRGTGPGAQKAPGDRASRFVVIAGGDVALGRGIGQRILREPDAVRPFAHLAPVLGTADLRFVNLESQLSDQRGETQSREQPLKFTGPPAGADVLARSGIELVSLANNHTWDYGKQAFLETVGHLTRAGVAHVGASREPGGMYEPTIIRKNGWSLAWFAVTHIWNQGAMERHPGKDFVAWADPALLCPKIAEARRVHDAVIVSYHGGDEYNESPMLSAQRFARAVVDAGADVLIGHHPHIPLGVGWIDGHPALYSLGNLVFPMHSDHPWTGVGFLARVSFFASGALSLEACPYHILGDTPMPFEGAPAAPRQRAFRAHLRMLSVAVGGTEIGEVGADGCFTLSPPLVGTPSGPARPAVASGAASAASPGAHSRAASQVALIKQPAKEP